MIPGIRISENRDRFGEIKFLHGAYAVWKLGCCVMEVNSALHDSGIFPIGNESLTRRHMAPSFPPLFQNKPPTETLNQTGGK